MRGSRRIWAVVFCVGGFAACLALSLLLIEPVLSASGRSIFRPKVILDAGHGGFDGGAVVGSVVEKDINLAIALDLKDMLELSGFEVLMTRTEDIALYDADKERGTVRSRKASDIYNRFKLIEQNPDAVFVSIHQNKFEESSSHGAQIFYGRHNAGSQTLAELMQQRFVLLLQPENHRQQKKGESNLYLLYHAKTPAILIECGFLSNGEERQLLTTPAYQRQVAFTIYCGLLDYYGGQSPALPPASGAQEPEKPDAPAGGEEKTKDG